MKIKIFVPALLLSMWCLDSNAKDSVLFFKASAGINYNHQEFEPDYKNNHLSHFSGGYDSRINHDTSSYSPLLRAGIQFKPAKNIALELTFSYRLSHLSYSIVNENSGYDPIDTANWQSGFRTENDQYTHHIGVCFGPVFYIGSFYISPKIEASRSIAYNHTDSTYSYSTKQVVTGATTATAATGSSESKKAEPFIGSGLTMGYLFNRKKWKPYIETQFDYFVAPWVLPGNGVHASLTIGLAF
ncbi:MAG: hypothetical protein ACJ77K_19440 [Bacteroidia bacterium]